MGFLRDQKINLARRLLERQYTQRGLPRPAPDELQRQAAAVVDEAGRIARQRGRNVLGILQDLIRDLKH
jgi:hypothetical protein